MVLLAAMQQENSNLRAARDRNDNMEQENDSLQERIASWLVILLMYSTLLLV